MPEIAFDTDLTWNNVFGNGVTGPEKTRRAILSSRSLKSLNLWTEAKKT